MKTQQQTYLGRGTFWKLSRLSSDESNNKNSAHQNSKSLLFNLSLLHYSPTSNAESLP